MKRFWFHWYMVLHTRICIEEVAFIQQICFFFQFSILCIILLFFLLLFLACLRVCRVLSQENVTFLSSITKRISIFQYIQLMTPHICIKIQKRIHAISNHCTKLMANLKLDQHIKLNGKHLTFFWLAILERLRQNNRNKKGSNLKIAWATGIRIFCDQSNGLRDDRISNTFLFLYGRCPFSHNIQ